VAGIKFSDKVVDKLKVKHNVTAAEVLECFKNRCPGSKFLIDTRETHKTDPATHWFIAETNKGRSLKICFIPPHSANQQSVEIKTAFEPNETEVNIYDKYGTI